jgi:hypothetical protein
VDVDPISDLILIVSVNILHGRKYIWIMGITLYVMFVVIPIQLINCILMMEEREMDKPLVRIQNVDGQTRILKWNPEEEGWDLDSIIMGDFDMTFEGILKYEITNEGDKCE